MLRRTKGTTNLWLDSVTSWSTVWARLMSDLGDFPRFFRSTAILLTRWVCRSPVPIYIYLTTWRASSVNCYNCMMTGHKKRSTFASTTLPIKGGRALLFYQNYHFLVLLFVALMCIYVPPRSFLLSLYSLLFSYYYFLLFRHLNI